MQYMNPPKMGDFIILQKTGLVSCGSASFFCKINAFKHLRVEKKSVFSLI